MSHVKGSIKPTLRSVEANFCLNEGGSPQHSVGEFEAAKASNFNKQPSTATGSSQKISYQLLRNRKLQ
jgi:hypothetical protein